MTLKDRDKTNDNNSNRTDMKDLQPINFPGLDPRRPLVIAGPCSAETEEQVIETARELAAEGVGPIFVHNMSYADESIVLRDVFRYDTLIVGGPTYNGGLYPPVARLLDLIAARCVPQRNFGWFGSFCWASAAVRCLGEFAQKMKWEAICEPVEMKQGFSPAWHEACHALAARIAGCMHR